jgi:hypothetical protein
MVTELMGWKSTLDITREDAVRLILAAQSRTPFDEMTNNELEEQLYAYGYGDDTSLPHYGYNFSVLNELTNGDNDE